MHYGMEALLPESTYATVHSVLTVSHPQCHQSQEQRCEFHLPRANLACHHLYKWHCGKSLTSLDPYTIHLSSLKKQRLFQGEYVYKSSHWGSLYGEKDKLLKVKGDSFKRSYNWEGLNISIYLCMCMCACVTALILREGARRYLSSIEDWGRENLANHKSQTRGISTLSKGFHDTQKLEC